MTTILQVFYSVFSALLLSLSIPNEFYLLGNPVIPFLAVIPFYKAFISSKSYRKAFWLGFTFTCTTHLGSSFWLANFKDFAAFTLGASAVGTGVIGGISFCFAYIFISRKDNTNVSPFYAPKKLYNTVAFRILFFSMAYTLYEWFKSSGYLAYPWGTVSSAMFNFPVFMQIADITGTYGVTFLTVMCNCVICEGIDLILQKRKFKPDEKAFKLQLNSYVQAAVLFIVLFGSAMLYGVYQYNKTYAPQKKLKALFVQQNWDAWAIDSDSEEVLLLEQLTQKKLDELKEQDIVPQLIVWNEGVLIRHFPNALIHYKHFPSEEPLIDFIKKNNIPLLTGGSYRIKKTMEFEGEEIDASSYYNSTILFDGNGNFRNHYAKLHLVPFAESIPGIDNPRIKKIIMKLVGISAGWSKGKQLVYFDVPCELTDENSFNVIENTNINIPYDLQKHMENLPTVKISTPICFDDAFTDVIRPMHLNGTELFINLTDDSWSLTKSSEYQHFVVASYRAIEYRTAFTRSTNAGYSVVLNPQGKILADLPLFEEASLYYEIPVYKRQMTLYSILGNWLPLSFGICFIVLCVIMFETFRKNDYIPGKKRIRIKKSDTDEIVITINPEDEEILF